MATKPSDKNEPADLDTFLKSKSIGDLSLKSLFVICGSFIALATTAFSFGMFYGQRQNVTQIEDRRSSNNAVYPIEPIYTTPTTAPEIIWLAKPILYTNSMDLHQCIDKLSEALRSVGSVVSPTSMYEKGIFTTWANLGTSRVFVQCHRTSIGGVVSSAVVYAPTGEAATNFWSATLDKLTDWRAL